MTLCPPSKFLAAGLLLLLTATFNGCGSGSTEPTTDQVVFSNGAALSLVGSKGNYQIQGSAFQKISAVDITVYYDPAALSSPGVVKGPLITGAQMITNLSVPGTITVAQIGANGVTGSGNLATVSFATDNGTRGPSFGKVRIIDDLFHVYSSNGRGPQP
ncbi:hypothetical protein GMST_06780 [Geomonas silvestris]|uniref:Cohesin domain-containing protein n=1 Tax=Geomonas silvestris TaxID=2740184 RepID=A0A6V8MEV5_9BACT|nr:cohesin domain-containing protein [Geomonas silvestris]GFO58353.1 hypothetical protein GMST_06780 [Geomonas silvestris]